MIKNSISYFMRLLRMFFSCKHCHFTKAIFFSVEPKYASPDYNAVALGPESVEKFYVLLFLINLMYTEDGVFWIFHREEIYETSIYIVFLYYDFHF